MSYAAAVCGTQRNGSPDRQTLYEAAIVILHRVKRSLYLKDWAEAIERRSGSGKARVALARKLSVIPDREENHDPGGQRKQQVLTTELRLENSH